MKSPQEVLLNQLSQATIGADFAFEPHEYRKGNAKREPADLVWACNNCVILMYMAQRKHKQRSPDAHAQMKQALIKHNLGQAKGWLAEWRSGGQLLEGKSPRQKFSIKFGDFKHIVVLSILDCGDNFGAYHQNFVDQTGVALCATIPHSAILKLLSVGGGMLDLVQLIKVQQRLQVNLPSMPFSLLDAVTLLHMQATSLIDPEKKWLTELPDQITRRVEQGITRLRAPNPNILSHGPELRYWELGTILNDLELPALYKLLYTIRETIDATGPNSYRTVNVQTDLPGVYSVIINATTILAANTNELSMGAIALGPKEKERPEVKGVLLIQWDTNFNQITFASYMLKEGLTNLEKEF